MALSVKAVSNHPDGRRRISQTPLTVTGTFSQLVTSRCGVCIIVMQSDLVRGIDLAYADRTDPLVFALTGRTGSGCTTAANTLAKSYDEITLSDGDPDDVETRKLGIATEFARSQWHPFWWADSAHIQLPSPLSTSLLAMLTLRTLPPAATARLSGHDSSLRDRRSRAGKPHSNSGSRHPGISRTEGGRRVSMRVARGAVRLVLGSCANRLEALTRDPGQHQRLCPAV
ncbi:MAG: hypothetical protein QOI59_4467, partial [Gammaproteobacteria bacterium]|nr:hypothetical protein [Gammaproteobacteria bacterium]